MNKKVSLFVVIAFITANVTAQSWWNSKKIKGNGNVVTETRTTDDYDGVSVGGSFDVVSGKTKRAPLWMQNSGLEWFYRFLQEPRRMWKRYLVTNTYFIYYVFKAKLLGQRV